MAIVKDYMSGNTRITIDDEFSKDVTPEQLQKLMKETVSVVRNIFERKYIKSLEEQEEKRRESELEQIKNA